MRSRAVSICVICAAVLALMAAAGAPAQAKSYFVSSCDASSQDHSSFGADWEPNSMGTGVLPVIDCPHGIVIDADEPKEEGATWVAWFHPQSTSELRSAEFKYYGGDTSGAYRYTARTCLEPGCPAVAELTPGASADAPASALIGLTQQHASDFSIWAECVQAVCPDPPEFVAKNFKFEYDDSEQPTLTDLQTTPSGVGDGTPDTWLKGGNLGLKFTARDSGSGVVGVFVGVDRPSTDNLASGHCPDQVGAAYCPRVLDISTSLDLEGISDGDHIVRIVIFDYAMTFPFLIDVPIHVDGTPPDEPAGLGFASPVTKWGWTTDPVVEVVHGDPLASTKNTEGSGWGSASFDLRETPNSDPVDSTETDDPGASGEFTFPHEGAWDAGVAYRDKAGNTGNRAHRFVGYDTDTPAPPDFEPLGWISRDDLYSGSDQSWTAPGDDPDLESGVCGYSFSVDDEQLSIPDAAPNLAADATHATVPASVGEGRHFAHIRTVACNGNASETATSEVNVDGSAPTATLHGLTTDGWITSPPNVSISASDAGSGAAALEFGFGGPGAMQLVPGSLASVTIPQGVSTLSYSALDSVGNRTPVAERTIKADWTGPSVEFTPGDINRPNRFFARVSDGESGVESALMQLRRVDAGASSGERAWQTLGTAESAAPAGAATLDFSRAIADESLEPGAYELRVAARDVAGNWSDEAPVKSLSLPLRLAPTLSAAIATYGAHGRINWSGASQDRLLRYGTKSALVGSLVDPTGAPIPGAHLTITETPEFGVERPLGEATTDADGEFSAGLPAGVSRRLEVRFDGSSRYQPATRTATIRSRAALKLRASRRTIRSGETIRFSGRLLSGDLGNPEGSKEIEIQFLNRRTWRTTLTTATRDSAGRFRVYLPPVSTSRPTTLYFHALAVRGGAWPFYTGSSRPLKIRVLP